MCGGLEHFGGLIWDSIKIPQLFETLALVSNFPEELL